jgi:hypothetical protein
VLKATAGTATISASFYAQASGSAHGTARTKPGASFYVAFASFGITNYMNTPSDWSSFTPGSVAAVYLNATNYMEGIVVQMLDTYDSNDNRDGTTVYLSSVVRMGFVPSDGAGCTLYSKNTGQRYHRKLGISLSTTINTTSASQSVRYNMSYLDTGVKATTGTNVLCVLSHDGAGNCTNQSVDFTLVSVR